MSDELSKLEIRILESAESNNGVLEEPRMLKHVGEIDMLVYRGMLTREKVTARRPYSTGTGLTYPVIEAYVLTRRGERFLSELRQPKPAPPPEPWKPPVGWSQGQPETNSGGCGWVVIAGFTLLIIIAMGIALFGGGGF
jgi:hypothetical protein